MGRKRKKAELKPFCFFCDRVFADEGTLIHHQKTVHFKCLECKKRLTGLQALMQHSLGVHKVETTSVPGAREDRNTVQHNILGMAGVPQSLIDQKQQAENAEKRAKAAADGHAPPEEEEEEEEEAPPAATAAAAAAAAAAAPAQSQPQPPQPAAYGANYGYAGQQQQGGYGAYPGAQGGYPGGPQSPFAPRAPQPFAFFQQGIARPPQPFGFQMPAQIGGLPQPGFPAAPAPYGALPVPPPPPAHLTMPLPPPPPRPGSSAAPAATNLSLEGGDDVQFIFEEGADGLSMEEKRAALAKYKAKA